MLQPLCHLLEIIFFVGSPVCIFGEVNMKAFGAFGDEPVCRSGDNRIDIVVHRVWLKNIEIIVTFLCALANKRRIENMQGGARRQAIFSL